MGGVRVQLSGLRQLMEHRRSWMLRAAKVAAVLLTFLCAAIVYVKRVSAPVPAEKRLKFPANKINYSTGHFLANATIDSSQKLVCSNYFTDTGATPPEERSQATSTKVILGFTSLYVWDHWFGANDESVYARILEGKNCKFTINKSYADAADVLVFHGCFQKRSGFSFPPVRRKDQRYVFVNTEAPTSRYCMQDFVPTDSVFNATATYKRDSDLLFSYAPLLIGRPVPVSDYSRAVGKTSVVFWYLSDCSDWATKRSDYVLELRKHIAVDVYGGCYRLFPDSKTACPKSDDDTMDKCFVRQSKQYKFYLSFENSICTDYITEKFFKVLQPDSDVVPVALGAPIEDYEAVAPPNSFIHVSNFSSPRHLADYLKYLDRDDRAYNAYHKWRTEYYFQHLPGSKNSIDQHPPSQLVKLCEYAHSPPLRTRVWDRLKAWYSVEDNCRVIEDTCAEYGICNGSLASRPRKWHLPVLPPTASRCVKANNGYSG